MNKLALTSLALGISVAASSAIAQTPCPPNSWLCADITIGGAPPPAPVVVAPPVYVAPQPPPPRVIIIPPRPRIYYMPPPPARVYYAPPPVVVYQPAPTYYQQPQYVGTRYVLPPPRPHGYVGIQASLGGSYMATQTGGSFMGGVGAGLRFRSAGHLGGELGFGYYWGDDYNGDHRSEIPVTLTGLFFFNPQNRFQIYGLLGVGASFADVNYTPANQNLHGRSEANYAYLGGSAGIGAELQLSRHFSLFADIRGFIRARVDDQRDTNPEFSRTTSSGATQTTNTSGGVMGQVGAALYF